MSKVKIKSTQGANLDAPGQYEPRQIGLVLRCSRCGTQRTYQITKQLEHFRQRQTWAIGVECECSQCGTVVAADLVWFDNEPGYTYRPTPAINGMLIQDEAPMLKTEE